MKKSTMKLAAKCLKLKRENKELRKIQKDLFNGLEVALGQVHELEDLRAKILALSVEAKKCKGGIQI